jgi:Fur family ferric uptake transcriptional regulator
VVVNTPKDKYRSLCNARFKFLQDISVPGLNLKKAGLKITLPRLKVLEVLEGSTPHHMSAEDVYKQLLSTDETVGLATVYRVLTQFESAGIIDKHNFDDGHSVYELAAERHHDHMVDVDNGHVTEFVNERIEALQHEIAEEHGYELVHHELVLYVRKKEKSE